MKKTQETRSTQTNILETVTLHQALRLAKHKLKIGQVDEAKQIYSDILEKFPKNKQAIDGLSLLTRRGVSHSKNLKEPTQSILNSLNNLYHAKQWKQVLEQCEVYIQKYPDSAYLFNIKGAALSALGSLELSIKAYQMAVKINPMLYQAYNNMGSSLRRKGKFEAAVIAFNKAISIKSDYCEAYNNLGATLHDAGNLKEAIEVFKKAIAINPNLHTAYNNLGISLKESGNIKEAVRAHKKAISIKPDFSEAHRQLSIVTLYREEDPQIRSVKLLLQKSDLSDPERCQLLYTQAKMLEDLGDFSGAFASYVAGGQLRKKLLNYKFFQDEILFERLKTVAPKLQDSANEFAPLPSHTTPIFILGMPRSGTTLVEQVVSSHSWVAGAGELGYVSKFGRELVVGQIAPSTKNLLDFRQNYMAELIKRSEGRKFVTDKMPHNFRFIALICASFPEAKIIHVKREAQATCWSNFKHYFPTKYMGYSYDLNDTTNYYRLYANLMQFWKLEYDNRIIDLNYDHLVQAQEQETKRLIRLLELDWEDACLKPHENKRKIKTASQIQVRQKVYKGSSKAWRVYEPYLDGIFDQLHLNG